VGYEVKMEQKPDFKILRHLRKHQDRWFTIIQLARKLHLEYNNTRIILNRFKKENKVYFDKWKMDNKGWFINIYKYKRDAFDEIIVDDKAHKK